MKHHFADFLDRSKGHWTVVPNRERWSYHFADLQNAPEDVSILTVTGSDRNWRRILELGSLRELTLHQPSADQLAIVQQPPLLVGLRITHARPKSLDFLRNKPALEELLLEYVSGIESLDPIGQLPNLRALHLENLRRVRDFSGLLPGLALRHLSISGTLDWQQPINDLSFLGSLRSLEYLRLASVRILADYPVFRELPPSLKFIRIAKNILPLEEFAYLEAKYPGIEGATNPSYEIVEPHRQAISDTDIRAKMAEIEFRSIPGSYISPEGGRFIDVPMTAYLLGKGTRVLKGRSENVIRSCKAHELKYRDLVEQVRSRP